MIVLDFLLEPLVRWDDFSIWRQLLSYVSLPFLFIVAPICGLISGFVDVVKQVFDETSDDRGQK